MNTIIENAREDAKASLVSLNRVARRVRENLEDQLSRGEPYNPGNAWEKAWTVEATLCLNVMATKGSNDG